MDELRIAVEAMAKGAEAGRPPVFLFHGPPGTGKTHAVQAMAGTMGIPVNRISSADIYERYYGETEKKLSKAFETAVADRALLFFDEADSLCWEREEGRQSLEIRLVNIMLQFLDERKCVVVFATNFKQKLDPALFRRIDVMLTFPFPEAPQREALWRLLLGKKGWADKVDIQALGKVAIAGGHMTTALRSVERRLLVGRIGDDQLGESLLIQAKAQLEKVDAEHKTRELPRIGYRA